MPEPTEADDVARIVDRLQRDHPDPAMREQLYADGKLPAYVRVLLGHTDDDARVTRVSTAVRAAETGAPGPS